MVRIILMTFILVLITTGSELKAQGCSDAGACTIGSLKPSDPDKIAYMLDDFITIGVSGSKGDEDINYYTAEIGYSKVINPKLRVTGKFNMMIIRGELVNTSGIADFLLNADYTINKVASFTIGAKIPFNSANNKAEDFEGITLALPMNYQVSQGTVDLIAGTSFNFDNFFIAAAIQYPVKQNSNQYTGWYKFPSTYYFERSGDVLARLSYRINLLKNKLDFIPGILPIYHLSNDLFIDSTGAERAKAGSSGLTLNLTSYFVYSLKGDNSLEMGIGFPLKTRTSRPEGLARKFALTFQFKTYF